jgi:hypothetical protein
MNKAHFESSLMDIETRNKEEVAKVAHERESQEAESKAQHVEEIEHLKSLVKRLELDLQEEKVNHDIGTRVSLLLPGQTPPFSPPIDGGSPSIAKLHEAHKAKVAELEV